MGTTSGAVTLASGAMFSVAVASVAFVVPDDTSEVALQVDGTAPTCALVTAVSFAALPSTLNLGSDGSHTV